MTTGLAKALEDRDEMTADEANEWIEAETRRVYGLTIEEFVKAAEAEELEPHPDLAHLVLLTGARTTAC